ncbi:RING-CH-type domain-containing protein [Heracleum sosnowskyi]|uniref:RING-CH-type domain-containing protein n=1 Tax=Heracleum sosnowskyi TaxID=360622 RepID=A0AAD8N743_9APIA|nr:RING-CH-type domain-containing protein [Heracleum sosnowskyi]
MPTISPPFLLSASCSLFQQVPHNFDHYCRRVLLHEKMKTQENKTSGDHQDDGNAGQREIFIPLHTLYSSSGSSQEVPNNKQLRKPNLLSEMGARNQEISSQDFVQIKMPPSPTSTLKKVSIPPKPSPSNTKMNTSPGPSLPKAKSSTKHILPKRSVKYKVSSSDMEKSSNLVPGEPSDKPSILRSWSLSKIFTPRMSRTSSLPIPPIGRANSETIPGGDLLPVTSVLRANSESICGGNLVPVAPVAHANSETTHGGNLLPANPISRANSETIYGSNFIGTHNTKGAHCHISRSLSVPSLNKDASTRKMDSFIRVIPSPSMKDRNQTSTTATTRDDENYETDGEDIPEEEAVCRICLVEVCEGGETLKLECNCKGELALAHQECAIKWFSIKGCKTCEVCKHEVKNLPVKLLRVQSIPNRSTGAIRAPYMEVNGFSEFYRVWQEVPILVIISVLLYFCFLEELLIETTDMGMGSVALSIPFSCILGFLAAMTSSTMVKGRFVWLYASLQFALVVIFAHLFFFMVHKEPILLIILATFAGFGVAMGGSIILFKLLKWRTRLHVSSS